MALPTTAILTALTVTASLAYLQKTLGGGGQMVPGIDSRAPGQTNTGVQMLVVSAGMAAVALTLGGMKSDNSVSRGFLYAAGGLSLIGTGLIVKSQDDFNQALMRGDRP